MPRPRQNAPSGSPLTPGQASYVLDRLISERRISPGEISRYVSEMGREITDLEARLQRLREAHGGSGGGSSSGGSSSGGRGAGMSRGAASGASAPARRGPGRPPGRPAGSGRGPGRPPGRPAGSGRGPGRPPGSGRNAGTGAGANGGGNQAGGAQSGGGAQAGGRGGAKRGRKRSAITPEQLASRQLQGRYLALVRQFPENRRSAFAKTAKEKGREAAIKEMQDSLKK